MARESSAKIEKDLKGSMFEVKTRIETGIPFREIFAVEGKDRFQ